MDSIPKILVADDDERTRVALADILLTQEYDVVHARDGEESVRKAQAESPDVILLDIRMPRMDGFEVIRLLKADRFTKLIPIVVVTGEDDVELRVRALKLGADDFLTKPPHAAELTARVRSLVKVKAYNDYMRHYQATLEAEVRERTRELNEAHERLKSASLDTIHRLSRAAEYKDEDTAFHLHRISNYAVAIARRIGLDGATTDSLLYSIPMHDIGKIGVPDRILLKPGKLDPDEWMIMKRHTEFGAQILKDSESDFIEMGGVIAFTHHERWDGSGYPRALREEEIPVEGRVAALADVFDALTTKRPYKEPFPNEKALRIMREGRGSHFDPDMVDAFFDIEDEILEIKQRFRDDGEGMLRQLARDEP